MSPKKKSGLHDSLSDIIKRQRAPIDEKAKLSSNLLSSYAEPDTQPPRQIEKADHPLLPPPTTTLQPPPPSKKEPVAPARDFARVANSIARDAMPAGLFKGTSKKLYDALYQRTRGAIQPRREIRAKQSDLMYWAGISHNTLRNHLKHLTSVGLLTVKWELGDNEGAVYEVLIPEELTPPTTSYHLPPPAMTDQKSGGPSSQKLVVGGGSQPTKESTTSESPKTSFKTTTIDDEAFTKMNGLLSRATYHLTLKNPTPADRDAWAEVAKVIIEELEAAANRAGSVSSVPAFLAEHLRRRFAKPLRKSREEKPARVPETPPQLEGDPDRRLTPEEITSYAATVTDLLKDGATLEDVTAQFAGSLHPEDWSAIRESATSKVEQKGS